MEQIRFCEQPNREWQHNNWPAMPVMLPKGVQPESPEPMPRLKALTDQWCDCLKEFIGLWADGPEPKTLIYNWKRILGSWLERRAMKVGTCDEIKFKIFADFYKRGIFTNGHIDYNKNQILLVADDWTYKPQLPKANDPHPLAASPMNAAREDVWLSNLNANAPMIQKNARELIGTGAGKTAYIVGNGPSFTQNGQELLRVKKEKGIIIGTNRLPLLIDPSILDYILTIDYSAQVEWASKPLPNASAVLVPTVNPEYVKALKCKDIYWFRHPYAGGVNDEMKKRWPDLLLIDQGLCCTFSAIHFAYLLGCNKICFVGQDMAYTSNFRHINEAVPFSWAQTEHQKGTWTGQKDMHGNYLSVDKMFVDMRDHIAGACYFLAKAGIRIVNASEHGILYFDQAVQHPDGAIERPQIFELRRLAEFIDEENAEVAKAELQGKIKTLPAECEQTTQGACAHIPQLRCIGQSDCGNKIQVGANLTREQMDLLRQVQEKIPAAVIKQLIGALR